MPLAGIDWRINARNNVFGILPGNLAWEHKVTGRFYFGATFKAITNSYLSGVLNNNSYFMRIDDNQLAIYADVYVAKHIVLTLETDIQSLEGSGWGIRTERVNIFILKRSTTIQ